VTNDFLFLIVQFIGSNAVQSV